MVVVNLDIKPGLSLGDFIIGMPIGKVIEVIQRCNHFKGVELKYNKDEPFQDNIVIDITKNGILLIFDPKTQLLTKIDIYGVCYNNLTFNDKIIAAPNTPLRYADFGTKFGPTFPGIFDDETRCYIVQYNAVISGIKFYMLIPNREMYTKIKQKNKMPFTFEDSSDAEVTRISIYNSEHSLNNSNNDLLNDNMSFNDYDKPEIVAIIGKGIFLPKEQKQINFNCTPQDVLMDIGTPSKIHYKTPNSNIIHAANSNLGIPDFFYNYFDKGFDILFDGLTKTVKKFIFHTNFVHHYEFNRYTKSRFQIKAPKNYLQSHSIIFNNNNNNNNNNDDDNNNNNDNKRDSYDDLLLFDDDVNNNVQSQQQKNISDLIITADTNWDEIQSIYKANTITPYVFNRGFGNPFGEIRFFGFPGIIFEVIENNYLGSICLFKYEE
eukprot:TRINITY_DN2429_c2_g1_i1.p1 TRINITY_DN2429_c2_g1~~TRINITY_DN2429_c2_g1_i1.p1  ORF type:complete len:434 (+),score=103.84 TRINITY_DN2429_c2_g1_i1:26-1327(+)